VGENETRLYDLSMLTIEDELKEYAQRFYLSTKGPERPRIDTSIKNIINNLHDEFGDRILGIEVFGSYQRKTILPRQYDPESDIDLLIVFDHKNIGSNPSTYRRHLHQFAEQYYPKFISYKSQPTVVLELNHIKYDLVPGYTQMEGFFNITDEVYIPLSDTEWEHTDLDDFSQELEEKNRKHDFNIKRVIRLLKAWNAKVGYPVQSYKLEQLVVEMSFSEDDIETIFFEAIGDLPEDWDNGRTENKIAALKENAQLLYEALEDEDDDEANRYLRKILPV
jgi:predicted nucleotidyltransferase